MRNLIILVFTFLIFSFSVFSQDKVITGTVISGDDNLPLIGATVMIKGTLIGTITDFDGNYTLKVPEDAEILSFSFVGFLTQEIPIGDQTQIDIVLLLDVLEVDEVVVTAIGIKREKKALGYSVQEVDDEEISRSNNDNVVNSLAGKVAGVHVNSSSGAAGSATFIEIRGASSITRDNRPLFVIDGIPIEAGDGNYGTAGVATSDRVGDLNPDDIESMSVLKGGAASALYGMRAANGVVVITTKKGEGAKGGQIHVNIHSSVSIDKISQVPELQDKYVQGSYLDAGERFYNAYGVIYNRIGAPDGVDFWRAVSWGPHVDSLTYTQDPDYIPFDARIYAYTQGGDYDSMNVYMEKWDPNGRIVYKPEYKGNSGVPDIFFQNIDSYTGERIKIYNPYDFFKTGITFTNSVNISGGDEKTNYYLSYANTNIDGIVPNNTYVKNNFKLSGRTVIGDDFTASANVNYLQNQGNRIQQGSNLSGLMLGLLRTPINFDNEYGYEFEDGTQRNYQGDNPGGFDNPYWVINNIAYKDNINRMIGNIELIYNPAPWINLTYRIGNDWYHSEVNDFFEKGSNAWSEGAVYKSHIYSRSLNSDIILSLNKEFGDLSTTLLLGQNLQEDSWKRLSGRSLGLELYDWNNIANSRDIQALEASSKARRAGLYGDLGLSYKSMVFLNFTARNDWSTTMPEGANSFFYPAVNLGFVFTSLPALEDNSILPYGKLRVSYGITGLDAREYATYTRWIVAGQGDGWTNGISFPFRGYSGFSVSSEIGNNLLKPEKQKTFEIGTDLRFINNLVRVDLGYFINNNENLLIPAPIAGSSGFGYKYMNIGSMQTKGIELVLGVTAIKTKDLSWEINLNFDNPNSVITYLADNTENISLGGFQDPQIHAVLDQPYRIIWGTQWLRDEDGNLVINDDSRNGTIGHPIQDVNTGNLGKFQPDYKIGLTNIVNYKGLTISALLDIKKGGQMWNGTKGALYYFGKHKDTETRDTETKLFEGRMGHLNEEGEIVHYEGIGMNKVEEDGPGEVNDTEVNMDESWYYYGPGSVFTGPVEDYVEKTDWFRLREVSVSYRFGDNLLQNIFIKKLEIYFTGQNLILITPYTGVDPETSLLGNGNAQGLDYFNMPGTKTYSFGIKLGF